VTITPTIVLNGAFRARLLGERTLLFDRRLGLGLYRCRRFDAHRARGQRKRRLTRRRCLKPYEANSESHCGGRRKKSSPAPTRRSIRTALALHVENRVVRARGLTRSRRCRPRRSTREGAGARWGTRHGRGRQDSPTFTFLAAIRSSTSRNTRDVKRVMKGGRVYTVEDLIGSANYSQLRRRQTPAAHQGDDTPAKVTKNIRFCSFPQRRNAVARPRNAKHDDNTSGSLEPGVLTAMSHKPIAVRTTGNISQTRRRALIGTRELGMNTSFTQNVR